MLKTRYFVVPLILASTAAGVGVNVASDAILVDLGAYLRAGHHYQFIDTYYGKIDASTFNVRGELRLKGNIFDVFGFEIRPGKNGDVNYLTINLPARIRFLAGEYYIPFGLDAQTEPQDLIPNSRAVSVGEVVPVGATGVRLDWKTERDTWPYSLGVEGGCFFNQPNAPLVDGAGRVHGAVVPGAPWCEVGASFYHTMEMREFPRGHFREEDRHFVDAPSAGFDVAASPGRFKVRAEYVEHFIQCYFIGYDPETDGPLYKKNYHSGYYGLVSYTAPVGVRGFDAVEPYARYERWAPTPLRRGDDVEDRYTGGCAIHFVRDNFTFRTDWTRILEEANPTSNDVVESYFQVYF